jgi:hypothetical protein
MTRVSLADDIAEQARDRRMQIEVHEAMLADLSKFSKPAVRQKSDAAVWQARQRAAQAKAEESEITRIERDTARMVDDRIIWLDYTKDVKPLRRRH